MENSQPTTQTENTYSTQTPARKQNHTLKTILLVVVLIAIAISSFLLGTQYVQMRPLVTTTTEPTPTVTTTPTNDINNEEWKTAKYGGLFSYEYPAGWHVAELWQENIDENGVILAIDPNPISTAPRGGPIATYQIQILNGSKNPDDLFVKKMQDFSSDNYTDITKQTIDASIGKIYQFKGKFPLDGMMGGETIEAYYFTFNQNPSDPYNQQVIVASLVFQNDPKYSEMLRHIVLSFKKLTP